MSSRGGPLEDFLRALPPVFQEAARLCLELAERDPVRMEALMVSLSAAVDFYKRRQTDEFSPESLMALK